MQRLSDGIVPFSSRNPSTQESRDPTKWHFSFTRVAIQIEVFYTLEQALQKEVRQRCIIYKPIWPKAMKQSQLLEDSYGIAQSHICLFSARIKQTACAILLRCPSNDKQSCWTALHHIKDKPDDFETTLQSLKEKSDEPIEVLIIRDSEFRQEFLKRVYEIMENFSNLHPGSLVQCDDVAFPCWDMMHKKKPYETFLLVGRDANTIPFAIVSGAIKSGT